MVYSVEWFSNSLYHHGIGGQKWGVRHGPPYPLVNKGRSDSTKRKKLTNRVKTTNKDKKMSKSENRKELSTHYLTRHKIKSMSDQELAQRIKRLQQEKELVTLSREVEKAGEGIVKQALKNAGKNTIETTLAGAMKYLVGAAASGGQLFDPVDLGKAMGTGQVSYSKNGKKDKDKNKKQNKIGF